jgi:outer membrane protein assembly factor BamB
MSQRRSRSRVVVPGLLPAAAGLVLLLVGPGQTAYGMIDLPPRSLSKLCAASPFIAVFRVEKINRDKQAIVYRKVRDLKGTFPDFVGDTFTHVLGPIHNPNYHRLDGENQDLLNDAILSGAAEGKTAVIFTGGGGQGQHVCVGYAWYTTSGDPPSRKDPWVLRGSADSRLSCLFCGDTDELVSAVADLLAGKEATVPHVTGTARMLSDRTAPLFRSRADQDVLHSNKAESDDPFLGQSPWSTHRGNPQRTGADDGPGPTKPNVLWVYKSEDHFLAPLVPGAKDLYASGAGPFNRPSFQALDLDPAGDQQVRWSKGAPLLRLPIADAPALLSGPPPAALVFGDGFHTDEGASLRCLRAADGLPLWRLPVEGKRVHLEGTPTVAGGKLYVGGGNAGVLCLDPGRVTLDGKEQDLASVQAALERRRKDLLAKYDMEKKKDPQFALPPAEDMLPQPAPKQLWQQGQDQWHVDAPVAVVGDRVLAASAYLDDDKCGERALACLKAEDGSVVWKAPLKLDPWAGPTVGPYVLVGCSSARLDPKAAADARGEVVAVELDSGEVKWRKDVPGGVLSSVAVRAGRAVFTATDGKVRAWDAFTGEEKWAFDAQAPFLAGPAVTETTVYAADLKGVVHALSLADGKEQWSLDLAADPATKTGGLVYGSPVVHGGRLYLATCNLGETRGQAANVVVCIGDR